MKRICDLLRPPSLWTKRHLYLLPLLLALVLLMPASARASVADIISLLQTITSTLENGIGGALSDIKSLNASIGNLHQQVVWPIAAINQARGFVVAAENQYRSLLAQVRAFNVNSATLTNPTRLEALIRSGNAGTLSQVQPAYVQIYGPVPPSTDAQILERSMMDMDDASAVASLKTATISDQSSSRVLKLADAIANQTINTAPGAAPLLTTQAQVANLESQAYLSKMLAADLRAEATKLAHDNAVRKRNATNTRTLQLQMQKAVTLP
jgi:hypothetical protein